MEDISAEPVPQSPRSLRRRRNPDAPMTTNQMVALFREIVEGQKEKAQ